MALDPKDSLGTQNEKDVAVPDNHTNENGVTAEMTDATADVKEAVTETTPKTASAKTAKAGLSAPKKAPAKKAGASAEKAGGKASKTVKKTEKPVKVAPKAASKPKPAQNTSVKKPASAKSAALSAAGADVRKSEKEKVASTAEKTAGSAARAKVDETKIEGEKTLKAAAAKDAASAAREVAAAKRAAVRENAPGSIYANAVREGTVTPDLLETRNESIGGIYAAAVSSGAVQPDLGSGPFASLISEEEKQTLDTEESDATALSEMPEPTGADAPEEGQRVADFSGTAAMPAFGRQGKKVKNKDALTPKRAKTLKKETELSRKIASILCSPPLRGIGGFLYLLGFSAECRVIQLYRFFRDTVIFLVQLALWLFGGLLGAAGRFLRGFFHDMAAPFVHLREGLVNTRRVILEEKEKAGGNPVKAAVAYVRAGIKSHGHLVGHLVGFVLPLVATAVLVFVVWSVLDTNYALAVAIKGETIGYIADETVLEDAKAMLRGRLRLAGDQNMEDWKFDSTMTLARADGFTSKDQLVNAMLRSGTADIVEGTGLYMDDRLVAVTTEGERLQAYLDDMLKQHEASAAPGAKIGFVNNVSCDPSLDNVFLSSSVLGYDDLIGEITRTVSEEQRYTVQAGDTLGAIALGHNLVFETLIARNPALEGQDIDYEPEVGTELLIQKAKPFLQVQTTLRQSYTEAIPYPVVEQETDTKALGFRRVEQPGVEGVQQVQDDLVYVDGELVDQIRVEELTQVVAAPTEEIIQIGTYDFENRTTSGYNPAYMWPVPDYVYSSRGTAGGHRGRDINAPEGTPIYAANAGVVVTSGWHYSYGNHIVIQHPDGLSTLYGHCVYLDAEVGDAVQQGQYIANVGNTGFSFGNHLHLEVQPPTGGWLNPDDYVVAPHGYGRA